MTDNLAEKFDPFNDRNARMIRNQLSAAFIAGLKRGDFAFVENQATVLSQRYDRPLYRDYVKGRLKQYRQVFAGLEEEEDELFIRVVLCWQQGFFFEVHELLEQEWSEASGKRRKALQGLIQAAGYYLLRAAGNESGAAKLADKAVRNISENRDLLPKSLQLDRLIEGLKRREAEPLPLA